MLSNFHLDENSWKAEAEIDMELFHQVLLITVFFFNFIFLFIMTCRLPFSVIKSLILRF